MFSFWCPWYFKHCVTEDVIQIIICSVRFPTILAGGHFSSLLNSMLLSLTSSAMNMVLSELVHLTLVLHCLKIWLIH